MRTVKKLGYFSAFIVLVLILFGSYLGNWAYYIPSVFVFVMMPIIDFWVGTDTKNVSKEIISQTASEYYYRFITFLWT